MYLKSAVFLKFVVFITNYIYKLSITFVTGVTPLPEIYRRVVKFLRCNDYNGGLNNYIIRKGY